MLRKSTAALLFLAAIIQSIFCAEWMDFGNGGKANQEPLQVFSGTNGVHAEFYGVKSFQTTADDGLTYDRLEFTGKNGLSMAIGFPQVPLSTFYIEVSTDNPSITVTPGDYVIYENYNLYPSQQFGADYVGAPEPEFEKNLEAYGTDKFYPEILAEIKKPLIMRGRKISTVAFYPVQYNPVTKQLKVYTSLDVIVPEAVSGQNAKDSYAFDSILKSFVINYESPEILNPQTNMLIITPDEFYEDLLPFKEWKEKLGIKTKIATRSDVEVFWNYDPESWEADNKPNSTYTGIDGYIKSEYEGPNPPDYLLIVGDTGNDPDPHVPVHYWDAWGNNQIGSDYHYVCMDHDENSSNNPGLLDFPDMMSGRISVDNNEQLRVVLDKMKKYEDAPYTETTDWYSNVLNAAYFQAYSEWDGEIDPPIIDKGHYGTGIESRFFVYTSELNGNTIESSGYNLDKVYTMSHADHAQTIYPYQYYNGDPVDPALDFYGTTQDVIDAINDGVFLINHRDHGGSFNSGSIVNGWGNPRFTTNDIEYLQNNGKLSIMFSINCQSGWFDGETDYYEVHNYESFGEELLRKESGGVVGFIGSTRNSYSGYNDVLSLGLNNSIFNPEINSDYTLGNVLNFGKMWMYDYYIVPEGAGWFKPSGYAAVVDRIEFEEFHFLGDPSMEMRTAVPEKLVIRIDYENDKVRVLNRYNQPVAYAKVTIKDDLNYKVGVSNSEGYVHFPIDIDYSTEVSTVVHNSIPAYTHHVKADEIWTAKDIRGNVIVDRGATLRIEGDIILPREEQIIVLGTLELNNLANLTMLNNAGIIVEADGVVTSGSGTNIVAYSGSGLLVKYDGILQADGTKFQGTNIWKGIAGESGSKIDLDNVSITDASTAISGSPAVCSISNSVFTDCENGIVLDACPDLRIIRNTFEGKGSGSGITVTQSDGWINNNTVSNYYKGINAISCSPLIVQNTVTDNILNGIYIAGYNTFPQMVNPIKEATIKATGEDIGIDDRKLNNTVYNNGIDYTPPLPGMISRASQIYMVSNSNIYLDRGMNNIYSDDNSVPCIRTLGLIPVGTIPRAILIYGPENYWGYNVNDSFFALSEPYYIDYSDPASVPYGSEPLTSTGPDYEEKPSKFLRKALEAELDGKSKKAIHFYEMIIDKYPDSMEAQIAYANLPDSYIEEEMALESLISLYDENITISEDIKKKFFKEMKVATHIKGKKYDDAIAVSEEMLTEAATEEEEILCLIDIAIANMLKNSGSKGRNTSDSRDELSKLYSKLEGNKTEPSDISETVLPKTSKLYQNYPNPFNPTTEIKYAITEPSNVNITVYNMNGEVVSNLVNVSQNPGEYTTSFDASHLSSGVFYYTLKVNNNLVDSKKMVLIR